MATASDSSGCGCGPEQRREQVMAGQILGGGWKDIVEEVFMKAGAAQARAEMKAGLHSAGDDVVVRIPLAVYLTFPRNGETISADEGLVGCVCTTTTDDDGSSVCVCIGACDFDACCDVDAGPPIVATS
jgi:hypothetical protein